MNNTETNALISLYQERIRILERENQALKLNNGLLLSAIENSSVSVVITDLSGAIEYVNPIFTEITGYTFAEVKGENPRVLKSDYQSLAFYQSMWETLLAGEKWTGEFYNRKKNGQFYWEHASIVPIKNSKGKISNFIALKLDITQSKLNLAKIELSEKKYQELFDRMRDAFCFLELLFNENGEPIDSVFLEVNDAFLIEFGFNRNEIIGRRGKHAFSGMQESYAKIFGEVVLSNVFKQFEIFSQELKKFYIVTSYPTSDNKFAVILRDISTRKKAELELSHTHQFYKNILNEAPALIWRSGIDTHCEWFNKSWLKFVGRKAVDNLVFEWFDDVHPEDAERCIKVYLVSFYARNPFEIEFRLRQSDGSYNWIIGHGLPAFSFDGDFSGYVGFCFDITNRKKIEEDFNESERRFKETLENINLLALGLDNEGKINFCNKYMLSVTGYTREEVLNQSWSKTFVPFQKDMKETFLSRIQSAALPGAFENEIITRNGEKRLVSWNNTILKDMNQNMLGTISIGEDITEKKIAEEELKRTHHKLELMVEQRNAEIEALIQNSPISIAVFDTEGFPLFLNNAMEAIFSNTLYSLKEANYNLLQDRFLLGSGYASELKKVFTEGGVLRTKPIYIDAFEINEEQVEEIIVVFNVSAVLDGNGKVYRVINITENITEGYKVEEISLELEERRTNSALMIEGIEKERSRIARELHDVIGQFLSAIKFNIETFEKSPENSDDYLQKAKQLLVITGKELKNIIYSLQPTYLNNYGLQPALKILCEEVRDSSNIEIAYNYNSIEKRFDPKIELHVYRIVQEALNNVVRHAKAKSAQVSVYYKTNVLYIYVKDNGIGFDDSILQSRNSTGFREIKRSIGLINMKERVEMLNGNIQIEPIVGQGVEIFAEIPITEDK